MKKFLFSLTVLLTFSAYSQTDYFVAAKDTTFCKNFTYKLTAQSYLASIAYTDLDGKSTDIKGRKNLENVSTFYKGGITIDKIPQQADKPESYVKWAKRVVDGKLIINYYENSMTTYGNYNFNPSGIVTTGITKFFIKMPDGTFYNINKNSDLKKNIIPYLKQCIAFNSAYNGDFRSDYYSFTKMIELYNSLCK